MIAAKPFVILIEVWEGVGIAVIARDRVIAVIGTPNSRSRGRLRSTFFWGFNLRDPL
jgi:hypothetical protein